MCQIFFFGNRTDAAESWHLIGERVNFGNEGTFKKFGYYRKETFWTIPLDIKFVFLWFRVHFHFSYFYCAGKFCILRMALNVIVIILLPKIIISLSNCAVLRSKPGDFFGLKLIDEILNLTSFNLNGLLADAFGSIVEYRLQFLTYGGICYYCCGLVIRVVSFQINLSEVCFGARFLKKNRPVALS